MESTLGDQAQLFSEHGVGHQLEHLEVNQEDDFDFEIGGDDDLSGEAENEDGNLVDLSETAQDHAAQQDIPQLQEQEDPAAVAQNDDNEDNDDTYQEIDASSLGPDNIPGTVEFTQDAQTGVEATDEEITDKNTEHFSQEENYYEETAGEFENLDDAVQREPMQDHDLTNNATSVDDVHAEDDFQEPVHTADHDETETGNNNIHEFVVVDETVQDLEVLEDIEPEEATQILPAAAQTGNGDERDDLADATLVEDDAEAEPIAQSSDQSEWNEEEDDHDDSSASPIVTVSYRGQEYSMFAQAAEDDPDTYFLDNMESLYQPLSEFLEKLRQVISSEIEAGHELFVRIDGLGLEFGESTAKDFVDQTTLAQIIEVNDKLSQNDGGSQHAELYIFLSARPNPVQRFAELAKGAEEGHGLSYFEQYFEESPAGVSLLDDEEKYDPSLDIGSDHLSPEGPSGENEYVDEGMSNLPSAEHGLEVDNQQFSLNDVAITEVIGAGAEIELVEDKAEDFTEEAEIVDGHTNVISNVDQEGDDVNFGLTSTETQAMPEGHNPADAFPALEQVETEMGEDWEHEEEDEAQDELNAAEAETSAEQTELLIDNSEEGHEHSDGENLFFMSTSGCLAPRSCVCNGCVHLAFEDIDGKADDLSSILSVSSPKSTDIRSFLLSDADWDHLMFRHQPNCLTATDKEAQDITANVPNEEDYLDLGHDANNRIATTGANAIERSDIEQHITPNSSATATLNGEENGQGNEANATQELTDLGNQTSNQQQQDQQDEEDEIDWNHEDDNDLGVADQSPTDLSPSSLSAKRSRQEDEGLNGLGEDSGMYFLRGASRLEVDNIPAAKRRRT